MQSVELLEPVFRVMVVPGHNSHDLRSENGWYDLLSHGVQRSNPVGENVPGGQGTTKNIALQKSI